MKQTMWLVQRAALAVALMVGFYGLAIGIALALVWIPYAEWRLVGRFQPRLALACYGAALSVLWALLPRPDRFVPPGPRLDESEQPELFRLIRDTAAAAGQGMPADVYLLNDVNAWVAQRGGVMGVGSRRVMGIGLPLLQSLSVSEFTAVIAHEFGHYASGDVALGPWIYKTRAAISRTIAGIHHTWLAAPFHWYGRQFLKITHAVSRQQEFLADQVAARVVDAASLVHALRRTAGIAPMFLRYVRGEVLPVMQAGFLPPIASGFDQFLRDEAVALDSARAALAIEQTGETDELDTHPSLRDRVAALESSSRGASRSPDDRPAVALLDDAERYARMLTERTFGRDAVLRLQAIDWTAVAERVYVAAWRTVVNGHKKSLAPLMADTIPSGQTAFLRLGAELVRSDEAEVSGAERLGRAVYLVGAAVGIVLLDAGWRAETSPGRAVVLVRDGRAFEPFDAVGRVAEGTTTPAEWAQQCAALGIAGRVLSTPPAVGTV